jgi:hypothetical protein
MRAFIITAALLTSLPCTSAIAQATSAPAPATASATTSAKYSTSATDIGTLLDNPATHAVLDKHLPSVTHGDQIDMARSMTLKDIQQYAPDVITDQVLAEVDAELAKIPVKK